MSVPVMGVPSANADREIVMSRLLDAPRALVWRAWTEPEHLIKWWGPNGFSNTFKEIDIREGGIWRFTMHGPDGTDYPNKIVYEEVVPIERLVYQHSDDDDTSDHRFRVTALFSDAGEKTRLEFTLLLETKEERDKAVMRGAIEGGNQTLAKLAEHLKSMQ